MIKVRIFLKENLINAKQINVKISQKTELVFLGMIPIHQKKKVAIKMITKKLRLSKDDMPAKLTKMGSLKQNNFHKKASNVNENI